MRRADEGARHASDRPFEHLADLAGLQVTELLPRERGVLLVVRAVEEDHVKVWIEPQVRGRSLHDGDRAGLGAGRCASGVEGVHGLDEDARQGAEQRAVVREPAPPRKGKRQHPLAERRLRKHALDQVGRRRAHAPAEARGAESAALAGEGDEAALVAGAAAEAREAAAEQAAIEVRLELLFACLGSLTSSAPSSIAP